MFPKRRPKIEDQRPKPKDQLQKPTNIKVKIERKDCWLIKHIVRVQEMQNHRKGRVKLQNEGLR